MILNNALYLTVTSFPNLFTQSSDLAQRVCHGGWVMAAIFSHDFREFRGQSGNR